MFISLLLQTRQTHCSHKSRSSHVNFAVTPAQQKAAAYTAEWAPECRSGPSSQSSEDDEVAESAGDLAMFNTAMEKLNYGEIKWQPMLIGSVR